MQFIKKRRKAITALLMSVVLPGYGQLYNGEINRGIWIFLIFAFFLVLHPLMTSYLPTNLMLFSLIISIASIWLIYIYSMINAWRSASRLPIEHYQSWQKSGTYAIILIACNAIFFPSALTYVRNNHGNYFHIPSQNMAPTIIQGDNIFAQMRYNCFACKTKVQYGDVIIYIDPNDPTAYKISRVIGLPKDRIQINGRHIEVNGQSITVSENLGVGSLEIEESMGDRKWLVLWSGEKDLPGAGLDIQVPFGEVFILGDNRNRSKDSRFFGTISLQNIVGLAKQICFSIDEEGLMRLLRFGIAIE